MGACHSDEEKPEEQAVKPVHVQRQTSNSMGGEADLEVESPQRYDQEAVEMLKTELNETPEIFVLNNMLMCVMFYENFQRKNAKLMHASSTKMEKELNPILLRNGTKNCIAPDAMFEEVNKNVYFKMRRSGRECAQSEQLVARRLYVVNGDIEVFDSIDVPQYSEIDKPSYRATLQDSDRKGYVKLRLIEKIARAVPPTVPDDPQPGSSAVPDEEIYDYATIRELKTPKPIASTCDEPEEADRRRDTLPEWCFCTKLLRKQMDPLDLDDMAAEELDRLDVDSFYETASYIRSEGFMRHFQGGIFPGRLAAALGFGEEDVAGATAIPGAIFCQLREAGARVECEIVPSVAVSWPAKQAFDFEGRSRPIITDRRRGIRYQWPTGQMIRDIINMNQGVVIPTGFVRKRHPTPDNEIEWEICFPKAERYVETRMTHAQIRCFLFLAALHKTFVEPETAKHGLLLGHVRTHLYWECETNYRDWPEHRLGTKMLNVLENLNTALSRAHLPDFFIKHKNVFENTPKKYLGQAQRVFHEVQQAPVMYFIKALKNLRYRNEHKFYPMPDFMELYKILTTDGAIHMGPLVMPDSAVPNKYRGKKYGVDSEHVLTRIQIQNRKKRQEEQKKDDPNLNRRKDSVDLQWICEKRFDKLKTRSLLCFFIKHFTEIARASSQFRAVEQGRFYLKQAWYLTKILEEIEACKLEAHEFMEKITKLEDRLMGENRNTDNNTSPPSTPTRKSFRLPKNSEHENATNNSNNSANAHKFAPNKVKRIPSSLKTRSVNRSVSFVEDNGPKRIGNGLSKENDTSNSPTEKITFITSF